MQESEQRARKFYAEPISLDSNAFVKMMVLDSCFIVELLHKSTMKNLRGPNDCIFLLDHIKLDTRHDLMLFENQLPFFIVMQLFNMTSDDSDSLDNLIGMLYCFFLLITLGKLLPTPFENPSEVFQHFLTDIKHLLAENPREDNIKHLLGLLHYCCCYEFQSMVSQRNAVRINGSSLKSATELQEAGIKFTKIERPNLFDIRFVNGTMEIPALVVQDSTETFLRNIIAYEQYLPDNSRNYFTAYHNFMDSLVNTSEDVEILTHHGIIRNLLGDNEVVAAMINKLGNSIVVAYVGYEEVYNNVNKHCKVKWNLWLAILRRKYFNNPWALISFLAAVVLLLLTVLQTIFSIHPVGKYN
ncbi:UPF0481 protein [Camellia lanceoleosa]|uniref:UPF0481 protein n=1 Tax=Camellia lanceoleosa TaxID=1840588 RepID=A0ACC0HFG6_9ERIC|nr:UPF0481 protein [Camellia lanceoleosa]